MCRARIIRTDGTTDLVALPEGTQAQRDAMRVALGCTNAERIRVVRKGPGLPGLDMWVDEDLSSDRRNEPAIAIVSTLWGADPDSVFWTGSVLFTGGMDGEGDALPLTQAQDDALYDMARKHANLPRPVLAVA